MDYCCAKIHVNFGTDPGQNGQMAAIFYFCYSVLHMNHTGCKSLNERLTYLLTYMQSRHFVNTK